MWFDTVVLRSIGQSRGDRAILLDRIRLILSPFESKISSSLIRYASIDSLDIQNHIIPRVDWFRLVFSSVRCQG